MGEYFAGVDLGTTFTAAAVARGDRIEMISLGPARVVIPSVVLLREDESITAGDAARQRGITSPDRVAREFKRRIGDPAPIVLGGSPYAAHLLFGRLLRWVYDRITERQGGAPGRVAVTHPANWGGYKREYLAQAIATADMGETITLTEPEAAALHYGSLERVEPGQVVAVYDLGGGTFDAAVLRKTAAGFEIIGEPHGIEQLGGVDFDDVVVRHVLDHLDGAVDELDVADPAVAAALHQLRERCEEAKIALSTEPDATVPVVLPGVHRQVRITREEFESAIRPPLNETIGALERALRSAGVGPGELSKVLLVGGSSRVPLVGQLVSTSLGTPVAVDADPKNAIALGAALAAQNPALVGAEPLAVPPPVPPVVAEPEPVPEPVPDPQPEPVPEPVPMPVPEPVTVAAEPRPPIPVPPPPPPPPHEPEQPAGTRPPWRWILTGGALAAAVALVLIVVNPFGDSDRNGPPTSPRVTDPPTSPRVTDPPTVDTPPPTPPPPVSGDSIAVPGDVATLAEALSAIDEGGTITLSGTIDAGDGITIDKPVTIQGEGSSVTTVVGSAGDQVLLVSGGGPVVLSGFAVSYEGGGPANGVVVEGAAVTLRECIVSGAVGAGPGGSGVVVRNGGSLDAQDCRIEGNQLNGVDVFDTSVADLTGFEILDSGQTGLLFAGNSTGTVSGTTVDGNGLNGVEVRDAATPTFDGNTISNNAELGVFVQDEAAPTISLSTVSSNGFSGIAVDGEASPTIFDSDMIANGENGIRYDSEASGTVRGNVIEGNQLHGIAVVQRAAPEIIQNTIRGSADTGIAHFGEATLNIVGNTVSGARVGLFLGERASARLSENTFADNTDADVNDLRSVLARGDGLGVALLGDEADAAIERLQSLLGVPTSDSGFDSFELCVGNVQRFMSFGPIFMSFGDADTEFRTDGTRHLVSFGIFDDGTGGPVPTDVNGIGLGSTFGDLEAAYGPQEPFFDELAGGWTVQLPDSTDLVGGLRYSIDRFDFDTPPSAGDLVNGISGGVGICGE